MRANLQRSFNYKGIINIDEAEVEGKIAWLKENEEPSSKVRQFMQDIAETRSKWIRTPDADGNPCSVGDIITEHLSDKTLSLILGT